MTHKEIFNFVKEKLLTQNKKSKDSISCLYRGYDGAKCAIGWLIPDELYSQDLEGIGVGGLELYPFYPEDRKLKETIEASIGRSLNQRDIEFLTNLQEIHDKCDVSEWEKEFNRLEETL